MVYGQGRDVTVGQYSRNQKRMNELIAYAKPYRLNVVATDTIDRSLNGGMYDLSLEHPVNGFRIERRIIRESVDLANSPETVLKGHIDEMRREMQQQAPVDVGIIDQRLINELTTYAQPFELTVKSSYSVVTHETLVNLTVKSQDYGFTARSVTIPDAATNRALVLCKGTIDLARNELGWKMEEEKKVAQRASVKPFVLECPVHGGAMVKETDELNHDEYFVCLVPGCKKKARRKNRTVPGSMGALTPPEQSTEALTVNGTTLNNDQLSNVQINVQPGRSVNDWDGYARKYWDPMAEAPVNPIYTDAHGHRWQQH